MFKIILVSMLSLISSDPLPEVVIVTTGGTIAEKFDPATGGVVPAVSGRDLIDAVPGLDSLARIRVVEFCNIDSSQMTPDIWRRLSARVDEILRDEEVTGVVVTHGTDTMAEGAFFLETTLESVKPVAFVGAMRSGSDISPDGPANLYNAVLLVCSPEAAAWGVTVTMNQYVNAARHAVKDNTTNVQTFDSGGYGYLGYIIEDRVIPYNTVLEREYLPLPDTLPTVPVIYSYAGDDGSLIRHSVETGAVGVVVVGVGAGNVNDHVYDAILYALNNDVTVVAGSRVRFGEPHALYGDHGGGSSLVEAGVLLGGDISPFKARLLLMLALAQPDMDRSRLEELFPGR